MNNQNKNKAVFQSFQDSEEENIKFWAAMSIEERFIHFDWLKKVLKFDEAPPLVNDIGKKFIVLNRKNDVNK